MDITTTTTSSITANTNNNNNNSSIKTPEAESETPTRIQPAKPVSFANGLLKRHHPLSQQPPPQPVFAYKECLKNHAAAIGGHALDGCGEFMSSPTSNPTDPTSLKCAACGCHRNFHRRETEQQSQHNRALIEFQPHHRHHPPPPPADSPSSPSPPPISSSYYPASAPHMLLALSAGLSAQQPEHSPVVGHHATAPIALSNKRKRFRTKFTQQQKEKMLEFAEKAGWKIQKRDDAAIAVLCNEIGVDRGVLKVWMHNNKSTLGKKSDYNNTNNTIEKSSSGSEENMEQHQFQHNNVVVNATNGNGSSTSS